MIDNDRQEEKALIAELGGVYQSLSPWLIEACLRAESGSIRLTLSAVQALELLERRARRAFDEE